MIRVHKIVSGSHLWGRGGENAGFFIMCDENENIDFFAEMKILGFLKQHQIHGFRLTEGGYSIIMLSISIIITSMYQMLPNGNLRENGHNYRTSDYNVS